MPFDKNRMITLAKELVATNSESPPGREADVAAVLRTHLESFGISSKMVGPKNRPNLIFSTQEDEIGPLVLHGHMDTVPVGSLNEWTIDPFGGEIRNGRFYGRGACDMKGPLAALAETMILYAEEGHRVPLLMLATSDEESGCSGAEEVAKSGLLNGVQFGVCAEPTGLDILVGEKGMLWIKLIARGKSAHGSRPEEGLNAIELCNRAIKVITQANYPFEASPFMGTPTFNVGLIKGGIKINVVPDYCEAHIDARLVKGQKIETLLTQMRMELQKAGLVAHVSIEYIHGKPAVVTPIDSEIVRVTQSIVERITGRRTTLSAATYGTDCSVLQPKIGITNVICGPGSIKQAHQPNEYIHIDAMEHAVQIYLEIARHFAKT